MSQFNPRDATINVMKPPPKIVLAIPCYNCEAQIGRVLAEMDDELIRALHTILIVDNRSTDSTRLIGGRVAALINAKFGDGKVIVVQNRNNYGLGGSHKVGVLSAMARQADYLGILHGDNQAVSQELKNLLAAAKANPDAAAILGARFHWRSKLQGYSLVRIVGNIGLNLLYSAFSGRAIYDMGSGLNLFRVKDLSDMRFLSFDDGFTFNMDLLLDYIKKGCRLVYVPITWREEDQVSNAKALQVGWKTLKKLLVWRFGGGPNGLTSGREYLSDVVAS